MRDAPNSIGLVVLIICVLIFATVLITEDSTEVKKAKEAIADDKRVAESTREVCYKGVTYLEFYLKRHRASVASKTVMLGTDSKIIPCKETK